MQLEITRTESVREVIEIEFPYYYKHDLMLDESDAVIYGKVTVSNHTSIRVSKGRSLEYELNLDKLPAQHYGCYMVDKYKSSESEFLAAKAEMLAAVESA